MKITKSITLLAFGALLSSASVEAAQQAQATPTAMPELSKSIVAEALGGSQAKPLGGVGGAMYNALASAASSSRTTASQSQYPSASAASLLPSVPLMLADGAVSGTISSGATSLGYRDNNSTANINLGFGYLKEQNAASAAIGKVEIAKLPFSNLAVGSALTLTDKTKRDLTLSSVWQLPDSGLRFKATGGYLWGNQNFDFVSGSANTNLEQFGYVFSAQYIVPKTDEATSLHSIGFSVWGARANQLSDGLSSGIVQRESATDYLVYSDAHALSEGRQFGASADTQIALFKNLVTKGSVGYEQIRFPFADGTTELNKSAFYNVDLFLELLSDVTLGAGYKRGATENRLSLNLESGNWQLNAYQNEGQNGIANNRGVLLSYRLGLGSSSKPQGALASRMQPSRSNDKAALLAAATARPAQLAQSFLAKVDLTAVTEILKISKAGLPDSGVTINTDEDILVTVGDGISPAINTTGVTRNGVTYDYTGLVAFTATKVVIHGKQFPAATTASDTYLIHVKDSAGSPFTITVTVE
ncbi:MAG: hypothetical protein WCH05_06195 [Chlorobiaceae bacterium]